MVKERNGYCAAVVLMHLEYLLVYCSGGFFGCTTLVWMVLSQHRTQLLNGAIPFCVVLVHIVAHILYCGSDCLYLPHSTYQISALTLMETSGQGFNVPKAGICDHQGTQDLLADPPGENPYEEERFRCMLHLLQTVHSPVHQETAKFSLCK